MSGSGRTHSLIPEVNILGMRFGHLIVEAYEPSYGNSNSWKVKCDCGTELFMARARLLRGRRSSCGHKCPFSTKRKKAQFTKHGRASHRLYFVWAAMHDRCDRPENPAYHRYGGRGISVAPEWKSFEQFWDDMIAGYFVGAQFDRRDPDGNYCVGNCRWVTRKVSARNRRCGLMNRFNLPEDFIERAKEHGVSYDLLRDRLSKGVSWEDILKTRGKSLAPRQNPITLHDPILNPIE